MKKLLKILLLPALAFVFSSSNLDAAEKDVGATFEIRNHSKHNLKFIKIDARKRCKYSGLKRDFVFGTPQAKHGGGAAKKNQYLKNYEFKTANPEAGYPSVKVAKRHNNGVIETVKVRYDVRMGKDYQNKYPCGLIIKKNTKIIFDIYDNSITFKVVATK